MVHQCVHCGKIYEVTSNEIIQGCECGSHFFFFIKKEQLDRLKENKMPSPILEANDKKQVEKDVRELIGAEEEDVPIVLDLESVNVKSPGKFDIDVVKIFNKKRPVIYKLEEGKYIIDLASTMKSGMNKKKARK